MAVVTFAGTTIWNDTTTGRGRVLPTVSAPTRLREFVRPVRSNGLIAKDLGRAPGEVIVTMGFNLTSGEINTLRSSIDGLIGSAGTLAIPPGQSYTDCVLVRRVESRAHPVLDGGGSLVYRYSMTLEFVRLR